MGAAFWLLLIAELTVSLFPGTSAMRHACNDLGLAGARQEKCVATSIFQKHKTPLH